MSATSEKATAIVLRVIEFSETSSIVTLFTREFGKTRGLAKGARRPKGPFESALDLLALCRIVFLRKSSETLDLLTEAKLERRFRNPGRDLTSLYAAYYIAELLTDLTDDYDPHPLLFDAAEQTLLGLSTGGNAGALVLRFEMTALSVLGHLPSLRSCVECGKPVQRQGRVAFGQLAGGVLCSACRVGKKQVVSVSSAVIATLEEFAKLDSEAWKDLQVDPRTRGELRAVLNRYMANLLGHRPRMHGYLGVLSN